jgi:DNA polymerase-3 subunit epsilon
MLRELVLDTETTGLDPNDGHRIVEVACLELINHLPSGRHFHKYVNPDRDMPTEAFNVHGLSEEFLKDHSSFADIAEEFLTFIGAEKLVIHNAGFDLKFLNAELRFAGQPSIDHGRAIDTLSMARRAFPGAQASLDALCRRFGIDNSARTKHGALLDAELLAEIYLELVGGRQPDLSLSQTAKSMQNTETVTVRPPRPHQASDAEQSAHQAFLETIPNAIWKR